MRSRLRMGFLVLLVLILGSIGITGHTQQTTADISQDGWTKISIDNIASQPAPASKGLTDDFMVTIDPTALRALVTGYDARGIARITIARAEPTSYMELVIDTGVADATRVMGTQPGSAVVPIARVGNILPHRRMPSRAPR